VAPPPAPTDTHRLIGSVHLSTYFEVDTYALISQSAQEGGFAGRLRSDAETGNCQIDPRTRIFARWSSALHRHSSSREAMDAQACRGRPFSRRIGESRFAAVSTKELRFAHPVGVQLLLASCNVSFCYVLQPL
jgi:hypothetical protein